MGLLYLLESLRTPLFDAIWGSVTYLGDEIAYMAVVLLLYWCVDKKRGYFAMLSGFIGMVICQFAKLALCVPRPFVKDPNFTIVESAREAANDYSFPSAHTLNVTATFGSVARTTGRKWLRWICISAAAAVGFSRMYLGVHTPWDVLGGLAIGLLCLFCLWPVFRDMDAHPQRLTVLFLIVTGLCLAMLLFVELVPFSMGENPEFAEGGRKNIYTMIGTATGVAVAYFLDNRFIHFRTEAPFWGQVLKCALGMALLVVARSLLKAPLLTLTGGHPRASALRYFIMALLGAGIWPMTFPLWQRVGKKKE